MKNTTKKVITIMAVLILAVVSLSAKVSILFEKLNVFVVLFFEIDAISFHNITFVVKSLLTRWNESTSRIHDKTICHPHITPNPIVDTCNPHRRYLHRPSQVSSFEVVVL